MVNGGGGDDAEAAARNAAERRGARRSGAWGPESPSALTREMSWAEIHAALETASRRE